MTIIHASRIAVVAVAALLTACAQLTPDQLYQNRRSNVATANDASQITNLDQMLLQSERFPERIMKANQLLDEAAAAAKNGKDCAYYLPLVTQALQQHHASLGAHKLAADCAQKAQNNAQLLVHKQQYQLQLDRMLKSGDGSTAFLAITIFNLRDIDAYLAEQHVTSMASYYDLGTIYRQINYVVLTRNEQGLQRNIHFNVQPFFEHYFKKPNSAASDYIPESVRALADGGDSAAQIGFAEYLARYGGAEQKQLSLEYLEKASAQNNAFAQTRLHWRFVRGNINAADKDRALVELTKAVENNYGTAEVRLAYLYDSGLLVSKDSKIRDALLKRAQSHMGVSEAWLQLAAMHEAESQGPESQKAYHDWVSKAAATGDAEAISMLAYTYNEGFGVNKDQKKAFALYKEAADKSHPAALTQLAFYYLTGEVVEKNQARGIDLLKLASKTDAKANFVLATFYSSSEFYLYNPQTGENYMFAAARLGHSKAMCMVGDALRKKTPPNWTQAELWLMRGVNRDEIACAFKLGGAYLTGEGPQKNTERALHWYQIAAENEYPAAFTMLGLMHQLGFGVSKSPVKAIEYYEQGIKLKHAGSMALLGQMYADGTDVGRDDKKALPLLQAAAEEGDDDAQLYLARFYRDGRVVGANRQEAIKWYTRAVAGGNKDAQRELTALRANAGR